MSSPPTVSAIIYNHNGKRYFEKCFAALCAQTLPLAEIIFVDCGSTDNSKTIIRTHYPSFQLLENNKDIGFAAAINQGIRQAKGNFILVPNMDVVMRPTYVAEIINLMVTEPQVGSATGKLLLVSGVGIKEKIDTTGHIMRANRLAMNRGAGEIDWGQYDKPEHQTVFGVSGALPVYRKAMLEDIAEQGEYFDESFHAYFEDVDIDWRANLRGWEARYVPTAIAYHERGGAGYGKIQEIQIHCWKNRYLLMLKNDQWQNVTLDLLFLLQYEISTFFGTIPSKPFLLKAYWLLLKCFPATLRKRKRIQSRAKRSAREMRKWFQVEQDDIQSVANTTTTFFFVIVLILWIGFLPIFLLAILGYGLVGGGVSWFLRTVRPPRKVRKLGERENG